MLRYLTTFDSSAIDQGDIFEACPIVRVFPESEMPDTAERLLVQSFANVAWGASTAPFSLIVLTQTCDLANKKATKVTAAVIRPMSDFRDRPRDFLERIRKHQVFGYYPLPAGEGVEEGVVDLRDLHTVDLRMFGEWERMMQRRARLVTPYREYLAQHFAMTFMRIGLPI